MPCSCRTQACASIRHTSVGRRASKAGSVAASPCASASVPTSIGCGRAGRAAHVTRASTFVPWRSTSVMHMSKTAPARSAAANSRCTAGRSAGATSACSGNAAACERLLGQAELRREEQRAVLIAIPGPGRRAADPVGEAPGFRERRRDVREAQQPAMTALPLPSQRTPPRRRRVRGARQRRNTPSQAQKSSTAAPTANSAGWCKAMARAQITPAASQPST